ncbi:MAG: hypothetical protein R2828_05115 [Saprospiraceae bacterium]
MPDLSIIKYYRLFEVKILHEYYLLSADNASFFDLLGESRDAILKSQVINDRYRLSKDLNIRPTEESKQKIKNYRWRFVPTQTGFLIGGEGVNKEGSLAVHSAIPVEDKLMLEFIIEPRNPEFNNFTNSILSTPLPSRYLFSNQGTPVSGVDFKSISKNIQPFQSGKTYATGALVDFGGNDIGVATGNTTDNNHWLSLPGLGFVNENDKTLLPKAFYYQFEDDIGTVAAEFKLMDQSNQVLKSITINKLSHQKNGHLNFNQYLPSGATTEVDTPNGWYKLEINLGLSSAQKNIYLSDEYQKNSLGIIQIAFNETTPDYKVIDSDQVLLTPIYEIRFLTRRTHFCYKPKVRGKQFRVFNSSVANIFRDVEVWNSTTDKRYDELVTKVPQPLTALPIGVQDSSGLFTALPLPTSSPLRMKRNSELLPDEPPGRLFSHIHTSSVKNKFGY